MVGIVVVCESRKNTMYLPMPLCGLWVKPCRSVGSGSGERGSGRARWLLKVGALGSVLGVTWAVKPGASWHVGRVAEIYADKAVAQSHC